MSGEAIMVWARPPTRSRASSTMKESDESFSACAAPRPAAPAPMIATSIEERRDMKERIVSGEQRIAYRKPAPARTPYSLLTIRYSLASCDRFLRLLRALALV